MSLRQDAIFYGEWLTEHGFDTGHKRQVFLPTLHISGRMETENFCELVHAQGACVFTVGPFVDAVPAKGMIAARDARDIIHLRFAEAKAAGLPIEVVCSASAAAAGYSASGVAWRKPCLPQCDHKVKQKHDQGPKNNTKDVEWWQRDRKSCSVEGQPGSSGQVL
jgi:hypothetical protein